MDLFQCWENWRWNFWARCLLMLDFPSLNTAPNFQALSLFRDILTWLAWNAGEGVSLFLNYYFLTFGFWLKRAQLFLSITYTTVYYNTVRLNLESIFVWLLVLYISHWEPERSLLWKKRGSWVPTFSLHNKMLLLLAEPIYQGLQLIPLSFGSFLWTEIICLRLWRFSRPCVSVKVEG